MINILLRVVCDLYQTGRRVMNAFKVIESLSCLATFTHPKYTQRENDICDVSLSATPSLLCQCYTSHTHIFNQNRGLDLIHNEPVSATCHGIDQHSHVLKNNSIIFGYFLSTLFSGI